MESLKFPYNPIRETTLVRNIKNKYHSPYDDINGIFCTFAARIQTGILKTFNGIVIGRATSYLVKAEPKNDNGESVIINQKTSMGRNKYSEKEVKEIGKLLRQKNAGNRAQQKLVRHDLRVKYEFNISDFNVQGKAFGEEDLMEAIHRGAIQILDDVTIEAMKAKRARDKARDEAAREKEAMDKGEATDWKEAMKDWEDWEKERQ